MGLRLACPGTVGLTFAGRVCSFGIEHESGAVFVIRELAHDGRRLRRVARFRANGLCVEPRWSQLPDPGARTDLFRTVRSAAGAGLAQVNVVLPSAPRPSRLHCPRHVVTFLVTTSCEPISAIPEDRRRCPDRAAGDTEPEPSVGLGRVGRRGSPRGTRRQGALRSSATETSISQARLWRSGREAQQHGRRRQARRSSARFS